MAACFRAASGARHDPVWDYSVRQFAKERFGTADLGAFSEQDTVAIAQHYGIGSPFLDITRCLDVALWFALHKIRNDRADHWVGPPGKLDQTRDIQFTDTWCAYERWTGESGGYIYVFDVPQWNGGGPARHGDLVDLSARPILSKSSRIQTQSACLLAADPGIDGGDLRRFYRCEAIPVGWPMEGAPRVDATTEVMFPDPSEDPWYEVFVTMPLAWVGDSRSEWGLFWNFIKLVLQ